MRNIKKVLYIFFGFIFLGVGVLGIILPIVPTTPLLLLASVCFVRGSKKFELWFKGTEIYKKYLGEFVKNRAMTVRQKLTILLTADCMIAVPFILSESVIVKIALLFIVGYKYYYFICKIKTVKKPIVEN
jgi:uncharacterized membrane protein YbaN (DUF454 family)